MTVLSVLVEVTAALQSNIVLSLKLPGSFRSRGNCDKNDCCVTAIMRPANYCEIWKSYRKWGLVLFIFTYRHTYILFVFGRLWQWDDTFPVWGWMSQNMLNHNLILRMGKTRRRYLPLLQLFSFCVFLVLDTTQTAAIVSGQEVSRRGESVCSISVALMSAPNSK